MTDHRAHVSTARLQAFVDTALAEAEAAQVARHLDRCPRCAARAARLDPLTPAFAAMPDPAVPPGLVEEVLQATSRPAACPWFEIALGTALLVTAGALAAAIGEPIATATHLAIVGRALWTAAGHLVGPVPPFALGLAVSTGIALVLALTATRAVLPEERTP